MLAMYEAEEVNKDCRMIAGLQVKKDKEAPKATSHLDVAYILQNMT